ncbi:MAG: helix-turn-helix transcriptional regulator [Xanthomonadales bacterium]|nr:helix-turn-helix transcriptional regulator [Xanthomonadales bacterium]
MGQSTHNADYQLLLTVLRTVRQRQRVTQIELAERLGNTQTFVSKCERGERRIDVVELVEFAEALRVNPVDILTEFLNLRLRRPAISAKKASRRLPSR